MEWKVYDFIRNPIVQNQVFFLESKCGFSILTRTIEELVEHENCTELNAARQAPLRKRYSRLLMVNRHPQVCLSDANLSTWSFVRTTTVHLM